jgi:hypothetical protein
MAEEAEIEAYLREEVKKLGGKSYKWISPGNTGVPDRIVFHQGRVFFCEIKSKKGVVSAVQRMRFNELGKLGFDVIVLRSKRDVGEFVRGVMVRD